MKKMIAFGILLVAFLVSTLASVSAYHYYNTDNNYCRYDCVDSSPDGRLYVVNFDGIESYRYRYVDHYGYPRYRVYYADDFDYDIPDRYKFNENIYFLDHSFNDRYDITRGESSGQAFCQGCKDDHYDPSNFRYKQAYDLEVDSRGGYGDKGYYAPRYSYKSGTYNWRY